MQEEINLETTNSSSKKLIFFMIFCAGLGGILYGYDIGVISGALVFIQKAIPMGPGQMGLIVGGVLGGGLVGTLITGPLADRFGRRTMIITACLIFILGVISILMAETFTILFLSRVLLGIAVGIVAVAVPLYLTEVAPAHIRGRSVTVFQLLLTFGILLAYCIDLIFTESGNWHAMFAVILLPTLFLFFSMLFLPETPRWLLSKNRPEEAKTVLLKTRPVEESEKELLQIQESLLTTKGRWKDLFVKGLWLPLSVSLLIAICNQLTGINVLLQYAPMVIHSAGLQSESSAMFGTIGIGLVNFLGTILSFFLIDRFGRRVLLITGTAGIVLSYLGLSLLPHLALAELLQAELSLLCLVTYIFFFAIGPGIVVWLAMSELMPTKVRGKALALALFANSMAAFILSSTFLYITSALGMSGTYLLFAGFTVIYLLVAIFMLPETKDKTLEEIQNFYQERFKH
ncbi:MAG: sugar porter family MFS transporter [Gammaproteobacteria bacterium]